MNDWQKAMKMALNAAEQFVGNTAPNPPVGCIALDSKGKVILGAGHEKAGHPHAEAKVLQLAAKLGKLREIETLVVTLEPCNHKGKTGPCTEHILQYRNIKRVVFGSRDPNKTVQGGGAERLRSAGLEVVEGVLEAECDFLVRTFKKWITHKRPWVTIKTALDENGSMIPPQGAKTFTDKPALVLAHALRKRSDAIWTGSGTVLQDNPHLNVRWIPDHPGKKRWLILSDRRRRISDDWIQGAKERGFEPYWAESLEQGLDFLGEKGVLEVLVEAGPTLRKVWLDSNLWDESVVLKKSGSSQDEVICEFREVE